jgi:hypothetical protein
VKLASMVILEDMSIPSFQTNFSLREVDLIEDKNFAVHMTTCLFVTRKQSMEIKTENIVTYLFKTTVELEKQQLPANDSETTFVSRQQQRSRQRNDIRCYAADYLINKRRRPLLWNGSVKTFPRKRLAYENGRCFLHGPG